MRDGGVSVGTYASLNLGLHVADDPAHVVVNRRLLEEWAGGTVAFATQRHGVEVAVVDPVVGTDPAPTSVGEFDALVSATGAGVAILVADCVPVLIADPVAGVVGAVHAGRAGLAAGVVQEAVAAMVRLGARPDRMRAAIGPSVCGECYEVPAELRAEVSAVVPAAWARTSWGTPSLDLPAGVAATLAVAGVRSVERVAICTLTDERFYSHRAQRDGGATGRFAGVIRRTPPDPGRVGGDR
ncbi:laccase domain-containing protein [Pengzhenrongella frigida]|uniref:Laccase domain-containing protein n=2 Tax=Pengzhenrongella frigida TaxID=1259133 RepID=A0A4Q5N2W6_9MICO|nr:laccase domain-containing protein [Cellulomonas sp. HLT2-17]